MSEEKQDKHIPPNVPDKFNRGYKPDPQKAPSSPPSPPGKSPG
jgi:hypothetical protein